MKWVAADDPDVGDDAVWWGLTLLFGIDMRDQDGVYLHPDDQVADWLDTYRGICAGAQIPEQVPD